MLIWQFSYHTPYQTSTHISPRAEGPRTYMGVGLTSTLDPYQPEGPRPESWYGCLGFTWSMIWKLSYHISYAESKARSLDSYQPVSHTWPGYMVFILFYFFCPGKISRITNVTNYHTFCAPQGWYVLESHVSITYAKWTYFLVSVW